MEDYEYKSLTETIEKLKEENQEIRNINEKLSLALESAENRIDEAIDKLNLIPITITKREAFDIVRETLHILKGVSE